jgi:hypothetical protein
LQRQHSDIDPDSAEHLLHADFFEFGSSGGIVNKQMVKTYLRADAIDMTSVDFSLHALADGVCLLTYRSVTRFAASRPPRYANRSSIWTSTDGRWQMFFRQGTPTKPF